VLALAAQPEPTHHTSPSAGTGSVTSACTRAARRRATFSQGEAWKDARATAATAHLGDSARSPWPMYAPTPLCTDSECTFECKNGYRKNHVEAVGGRQCASPTGEAGEDQQLRQLWALLAIGAPDKFRGPRFIFDFKSRNAWIMWLRSVKHTVFVGRESRAQAPGTCGQRACGGGSPLGNAAPGEGILEPFH
jgi:hypothetical protein